MESLPRARPRSGVGKWALVGSKNDSGPEWAISLPLIPNSRVIRPPRFSLGGGQFRVGGLAPDGTGDPARPRPVRTQSVSASQWSARRRRHPARGDLGPIVSL